MVSDKWCREIDHLDRSEKEANECTVAAVVSEPRIDCQTQNEVGLRGRM